MRRPESASTPLWLAIAGIAPIAVGGALVGLRDVMLNTNVALVLVFVVVLAAVVGGRGAGAVAALSAAVSFNFFHTVPYLTLNIDSSDDIETTLLLLAVGLAVGQLANYRRHPLTTGERPAEEIRHIHRVAAVAEGPRHTTTDVISTAETELAALLELDRCRFEASPFDEELPRVERSGVMSVMEYHGRDSDFALPSGGAELPVLGGGSVVGRFVLVPGAGSTVSLERRVVAVAVADQVGAALTGRHQPILNTEQGGVSHG